MRTAAVQRPGRRPAGGVLGAVYRRAHRQGQRAIAEHALERRLQVLALRCPTP